MEMTPADLAVLTTLRDLVAQNAIDKGFREAMKMGMTDDQWNGALGELVRAATYTSNQIGESIEFWEAFRAGKLDQPCDKGHKMEAAGLPVLTNAEEEIADEIIRALDKAHAFGVDVARAVAVKHAYNRTRPHLHGNKRA